MRISIGHAWYQISACGFVHLQHVNPLRSGSSMVEATTLEASASPLLARSSPAAGPSGIVNPIVKHLLARAFRHEAGARAVTSTPVGATAGNRRACALRAGDDIEAFLILIVAARDALLPHAAAGAAA